MSIGSVMPLWPCPPSIDYAKHIPKHGSHCSRMKNSPACGKTPTTLMKCSLLRRANPPSSSVSAYANISSTPPSSCPIHPAARSSAGTQTSLAASATPAAGANGFSLTPSPPTHTPCPCTSGCRWTSSTASLTISRPKNIPRAPITFTSISTWQNNSAQATSPRHPRCA